MGYENTALFHTESNVLLHLFNYISCIGIENASTHNNVWKWYSHKLKVRGRYDSVHISVQKTSGSKCGCTRYGIYKTNFSNNFYG